MSWCCKQVDAQIRNTESKGMFPPQSQPPPLKGFSGVCLAPPVKKDLRV